MNNNNFFLEVFNNLLKINDSEILIIFDVDGNIWFKYKELLEALGYNYADDALSNLKISISNKSNFENLKVPESFRVPSNFQKNTIFINESGLYEVLSISTKPLAKIFMNKYFQEIMPKIRKTGQFILNKSDKQKLDKLNNTINNYKQEMTYYNDKYKFIPSENGHLYINEDNTIKNGKEIKCFKIGYATDMKKRLGEYKVGMLKDDN
jgi:prophage antirepressor-like protein